MKETELLHSLTLLCLYLITGFLFLFQSYDKIFRIGVKNVSREFSSTLPHVPYSILYSGILASSIIEFVCGLFLITGLFTQLSLMFLFVEMTGVAIVFSMIRPMWDMQYYFPRLALLITLIVLPDEWNRLSLIGLFVNP
ncbi:MAG: DoxX family membrane protein [Bacteroidota bacterium]